MSAPRPVPSRSGGGRHAADGPDPPTAPSSNPWWRRLLPRDGDLVAGGGQVVLRVRGALDDVGAARLVDHVRSAHGVPLHQVVVVHLEACDFVNARGLRALLLLHDHVALHSGRLLVLDPPRTLRIMCRAAPCPLVLVPAVVEPRPQA